MQRTLKREFKELEVVEREAIAANCRTTCCEIAPYLLRRVGPGKDMPLLKLLGDRCRVNLQRRFDVGKSGGIPFEGEHAARPGEMMRWQN